MSLHRPPPAIAPQIIVGLPPATEVEPGRPAWPDIFHYEFDVWAVVDGRLVITSRCSSPLPPADLIPDEVKNHPDAPIGLTGRRMQGLDTGRPRVWPYRYVIEEGRLAAFERLSRAGVLAAGPHVRGSAGGGLTDGRDQGTLVRGGDR